MLNAVITSPGVSPDDETLGCDVFPNFRVEIGRGRNLDQATLKTLEGLGVSNTSIGDRYYPVVVILDRRSVMGLFLPGICTQWWGKAEDEAFVRDLDRRIAPGGDLYAYHETIETLVAFRCQPKLSDADVAAIAKAEAKRQWKAGRLVKQLSTVGV
jgi:hypothetical protein